MILHFVFAVLLGDRGYDPAFCVREEAKVTIQCFVLGRIEVTILHFVLAIVFRRPRLYMDFNFNIVLAWRL
jgi:hypothetical protein